MDTLSIPELIILCSHMNLSSLGRFCATNKRHSLLIKGEKNSEYGDYVSLLFYYRIHRDIEEKYNIFQENLSNKVFYQNYIKINRAIRNNINLAIAESFLYGDIFNCKIILENITQIPYCSYCDIFFRGYYDIIVYIYEKNLINCYPAYLVGLAAMNGYLNIVKFFASLNPPIYPCRSLMYGILHNGQLEVCKYLFDKIELPHPSSFKNALKYGHLDLINYYLKNSSTTYREQLLEELRKAKSEIISSCNELINAQFRIIYNHFSSKTSRHEAKIYFNRLQKQLNLYTKRFEKLGI